MSDYDSDLVELARAIGASVEKTDHLASAFSPGRNSGDELTDWDILKLAMRLGRRRYVQWKQLMSKASEEQTPVEERPLATGQVKLSTKLATDFHKSLVTGPWLLSLENFLSAHPALGGLGGSGHLIPAFNEARYMGPQSVVKYRFSVAVVANQPYSSVRRQVVFFVEYRPLQQDFKLFWFSVSLEWRWDVLKERLVARGVLETHVFDRAVAEVERGSRVERLLGLATPVKLLLRGGELQDEQLVDLLIEECGFSWVDPKTMVETQELWHENHSEIYRALRLDSGPVPLVVMSTAAGVDDFAYLASGSGGALPAFTAPGLVDRMLAERGIAPKSMNSDMPKEVIFISRPEFTPLGPSAALPLHAPMPELKDLVEKLTPNVPFFHRFTPEEAGRFGPESLRVRHEEHSFSPVLLNVRVHAEGSENGVMWTWRTHRGYRHPVDLDSVRELLNDPRTWSPQYLGPVGSDWQLEWWNPPEYRALHSERVGSGPFLELCLALLRMAGFEFEISRHPTGDDFHYVSPSETQEG